MEVSISRRRFSSFQRSVGCRLKPIGGDSFNLPKEILVVSTNRGDAVVRLWRAGESFNLPKEILVVSTGDDLGKPNRIGDLFQSPEGDSRRFNGIGLGGVGGARTRRFQSPEGDSRRFNTAG